MPIINLNRSRFFAPGWRGVHPRFAWKTADLTKNMAGYSVQRTDDPPSPAPKLDIILLHGDNNATTSIGRRLAQDLGQGYIHLDVYQLLWEVNALPDGKHKAQALGLLHPLPLKRYIDRESQYLSSRLIIEDVLLRHINRLVSAGLRRFIITGFADFKSLWHFQHRIAKAEAVIWVEEVDTRDVKTWMRGMFGEGRCIFLNKEGCTCVEDLYGKLLRVMGEKASLWPRVLKKDASKKTNEMAMMTADSALQVNIEDSPAASDDEILDDDTSNSAGEGPVKVEREDTPMMEAQDGYDVAMDLLQELEEHANSSM